LENVKELVQLKDTEGCVQAIFKEFGNNLATFIKPFMVAESRNVLILGGSIAKAYDLFIGELEKLLTSENIQIQVRHSVLGESASLMGAASFCQQEHESIQPAFVHKISRG
jgi:glucokinase